MKKNIVLIGFLLLAVVFAQLRWGTRITLGDKFVRGDSLVLMGSSVTDTLFGQDTLYSGFLDVAGANGIDGIYNVSFYADSTLDTKGGGSTIDLDMRYRDRHWPTGLYSDWINIFNAASRNTINKVQIATADSSWWVATNVIQYRLIQDTLADNLDSTVIYLGDFVK